MSQQLVTCGEFLVKQLEAYGIETIFGIPGVHTIELYRGLPQTTLKHITPRHEQGAGFMADGYARVKGKPAACFIITGPGMTNILTAMGQAYADSIPMLVISSVNEVATLGMKQGRLHELYSQRDVVSGVCEFSHTILDPSELPEVLAKAFTVFNSERPRPVHIEIPTDVITKLVDLPVLSPARLYRPEVSKRAIEDVYQLLQEAKNPYLLIGGGAMNANSEHVVKIAEQFDMPVLYTINGKGVFPPEHPLAIGSYQTTEIVREAILKADVVLALGTELGETDYDVAFNGEFKLNAKIIRVDIDPEQLHSNFLSTVGIVSDAASFSTALSDYISAQNMPVKFNEKSAGVAIVKSIKDRLQGDFPKEWNVQYRVLQMLQENAPEMVFVGDSTQIVYSGNFLFEPKKTRKWFNSATGYGTLGYGLPAAIGAKIANPAQPVVSLMGDGGIQFSLPELATAVEEKVGIIVLLWNNFGYQEIKRYMTNHEIATIGVDIYTPDFATIAKGYGCETIEITSIEQLQSAVIIAQRSDIPTFLLLDEAALYAEM